MASLPNSLRNANDVQYYPHLLKLVLENKFDPSFIFTAKAECYHSATIFPS